MDPNVITTTMCEAALGDPTVLYYTYSTIAQTLAGAFGIQSIPSLLFIPKEGEPQMSMGALPKKDLKKIIDRDLLGVSAE